MKKATAKMVKIRFGSISLKNLDDFKIDNLRSLYENNSKFKSHDSYYYWNFSWSNTEYAKSSDEEKKEIFANKEILNKLIDQNPIYDEFEITVSLETYTEYLYEFHNKVTISILDKFEIDYEQKVINSKDNLESALELIQRNIELFDKQMAGLNELAEQHYNLKCNTVVTDTFLTSVNQIKLLNDACSDYLQENLKDGWRILAITPQPNQRRPDYILGKIVDKNDVKDVALR